MELGTQVAMLVYKLFGGSVNSGIPGAADGTGREEVVVALFCR